MTDYGIRIKNVNNEIQIDSLYRNYVLEASGSLNTRGLTTVNITNNTEPPIVMIRPTGSTIQACGIWDLVFSSPNYTGVRFSSYVEYPNSAADCPFDYKIFTLRDTKSAETYGLRIYNPDKKMVYDSGYKPFKILEIGSATIGTTYTHSSHTSPYYIYTPIRQRYISAPGMKPLLALRQGLAKQSTTSVKPVWAIVGGLGVSPSTIDGNSGTTMSLIICE
jgi:hypothetical protein